METPQLPDMIPDAAEKPKLIELITAAAQHPMAWFAVILSMAVGTLFGTYVLSNRGHQQFTEAQLQQCESREVKKDEEIKALKLENTSIYRELLIKNGIINSVQQKADSLQSQ